MGNRNNKSNAGNPGIPASSEEGRTPGSKMGIAPTSGPELGQPAHTLAQTQKSGTAAGLESRISTKISTKSQIDITPQEFEINIDHARNYFRKLLIPTPTDKDNPADKHNLYSFMKDVIGVFPKMKNTPTQLLIIDSFEKMVGAALTTYNSLDAQLELSQREKELEKIEDSGLRASSMESLLKYRSRIVSYSMFVGAVIGLKAIEDQAKPVPVETKITGLNFRMGLEKVLAESFQGLFKLLIPRKKEIAETEEQALLTYLSSWYQTLINTTKLTQEQFLALARTENLVTKLKIDGIAFDAFSYTSFKIIRPDELMDISLDDIVGFKEPKEAAMNLINNTLAYSFSSGKNPRSPFKQTLFTISRPGEGKTAFAHAVANEFIHMCEEIGVPCKVIILRSTDYGTAYQFESAKNLKNWIDNEIANWNGLVLVYSPDFDTQWVARDSPNITSDQMQVQQIMYGIFDGTIGKRNGKWFWLADANFVPEDAAYSRLKENANIGKGVETAEDRIRLIRDIQLGRYKDNLRGINQKEWDRIGQVCREHDLNGRACHQIALGAIERIQDYEVPNKYYLPTTTYEERQKIDKSLANSLTFKDIKGLVEKYIDVDKERIEEERNNEYKAAVESLLGRSLAAETVDQIMVGLKGRNPEEMYRNMVKKPKK